MEGKEGRDGESKEGGMEGQGEKERGRKRERERWKGNHLSVNGYAN